MLNRLEVGHDMKTAFERNKGKAAKVNGITLMEKVLWKRGPNAGGLGKLQSMWDEGVFLGVKGTTGEFIVGDAEGVHRTRTVHRRPAEERWTSRNMTLVGGVPWRKSEADIKQDGVDLPTRELTEEEKNDLILKREWRDMIPKRFGIRLQDLKEFGPTNDCKG